MLRVYEFISICISIELHYNLFQILPTNLKSGILIGFIDFYFYIAFPIPGLPLNGECGLGMEETELSRA